MTTSLTPSPEKSLPVPNTLCHSFDPRNTTPMTTTISMPSVNPLTSLRLRRPRASRIRSARVLRRRGGPTATGSARSRPQSSDIPDLSVRGQRRAPLVQPVLQDADCGGLVDHRSLPLGADSSLSQRPLGSDGGESLVGQSHRHRRDARRQLIGEPDGVVGRPNPNGRPVCAVTPPPPRPPRVRRPTSPAGARVCPNPCGGPARRFPPESPGCRPGR